MDEDRQDLAPGDQAPAGTKNTGENLCPDCVGSGQLDGDRCPTCEGTGKVIEGIGGV
jgi:DnaJ-class molecular chaperone